MRVTIPPPRDLLVPLLTAAALWAMPGVAEALSFTYRDCAIGSNNLRMDCVLETDASATVHVEFCDNSSPTCTPDRQTLNKAGTYTASCEGPTSPCYQSEFTLRNMLPGTDYLYRGETISGSLTSPSGTETTGSLPTMYVDDISLSTDGTADEVDYLLFNYGCSSSAGNYQDYLLIADAEGNIVWYEDVTDVTGGSTAKIKAVQVLEGKYPAVIVDDDWYIEYDLEGTVRQSLNASTDGDFDEPMGAHGTWYPHHDIWRDSSGFTYIVAAHDEDVTDVCDCDSDYSYADNVTWVVDGVVVFDDSWALDSHWDLDVVYDYASTGDIGCPGTHGGCAPSGGYWSGKLSGRDWSHMNSISTRGGGSQYWVMSLNRLSRVIQTDSGSLQWELEGKEYCDGGGDFEAYDSNSQFASQHAARFYDDYLLMFDNHNGGCSAMDSRGIEIDLDTSGTPWTFEVVAEYDTGTACGATGSNYELTEEGNVVTTCNNADTFQEFDVGTETEVWSLGLACGTYDHHGALYRGVPIGIPQ